MPSERDRDALEDMLLYIDLAFRFTSGFEADVFGADLRTLFAATRCLEIISEASRRLSDDIKTRHPNIQWVQMAGAGNIYRHNYEHVAARRIWDTIQLALPPLRTVILSELERPERT